MTAEPHAGEAQGRTEEPGSSRHEIERAVLRLNAWVAENQERIPRCLDWRSFRRRRAIPAFRAVSTTALKGWGVADLNRLFRVLRRPESRADGDVEVPIELLVADQSLQGTFLNAREVIDAAFDVFAARHFLGRFSPRLRWFWSQSSLLAAELQGYVDGIRLRMDAATPVPHDQRRVFEDFQVPLQDGQQTAIGGSCMFLLEYAQPPGAVPYWRFSVTRHGEAIVEPQVLRPKPIYHEDELLAVIKKVGGQAVTLSVLTSEGG